MPRAWCGGASGTGRGWPHKMVPSKSNAKTRITGGANMDFVEELRKFNLSVDANATRPTQRG
jgi:hypothetical protein